MNNQNKIERIPLRVPSGWIVGWHSFFEVTVEEAMQKNGELNSYFIEDLLWIRRQDHQINFDLGWYPDMDLSGAYELRITKAEDEEPFEVFTSRSSQDITNRIEYFLRMLCLVEQRLVLCEKLVPLRFSTGWEVTLNHWTKDLTYKNVIPPPLSADALQDILVVTRDFYGLIRITVQLFRSPFPVFILTLRKENQPDFYKKAEVKDEKRAVTILENWMDLSYRGHLDVLLVE